MDLTVRQFDKIEMLADRFRAEIRCWWALREGRVVAGALLFLTPTTVLAQ